MNTDKIEKYLQNYLDNVVSPEINTELVGEDDEPIKLTVYKVNYGESNPNRINFFIDIDPDYSKGSIIHTINIELSRFKELLGIDQYLHIYWNKRPFF